MSSSRYILEGTTENFDRLVIDNSRKGLVLVDFWAPWAGPSLRQREILCDLARRYEGRFLLVAVNTDEQKPLAERFGVRSLPSFKLFRHGQLVEEYHGVQPEADYPRIIEQQIARQLDPVSARAVAAWQAGEPERALQLLAEAAVDDPQNLAYPALMGKILMREGREEDAHTLLSALPEAAQVQPQVSGLLDDPEDAPARYQLAASLLMADHLEEALEQLLYLTRHHSDYRQDIARKGMRAVLERLDGEDPRVARYRRELYRLDY